ncbi:MAG: hypothetical protein WDN47_00800 [Candidatus Doudnabacteria bacterium]
MKVEKDYLKKRKEQHIHSPAHALADELSNKFSDRKHFGFYLKMATSYNHDFLRRLAGEVLEQKPKKPGALFAFLIKKSNNERNA